MKRFACALLLVLASADAAHAATRAEAAAVQALKKAEDDYLTSSFDKGLSRLQAAERACGEGACTPATRAALVRDIGVMELRLGKRDAALASFRRAKKIDGSIALNPSYETKDLREAWDASAPAPQPASGDLVHVPPRAAAARTPLAIYVEPATTEPLAKVVVRYKSPSTDSFRRAVLEPIGNGWGGYIPCADVVPGTLVYYIQAFAKDGDIVATLGDQKNAFSVTVRESLDGEPPSLPGRPPPRECGQEQLEALDLGAGMRCEQDNQCRSGSCVDGRCAAPEHAEATDDRPRDWARVWVGVSGSLDFTALPAQNDVCLAQGTYYCTTPQGADYPSGAPGDVLVAGRAGAPPGQVVTGGVHVTATIDWAVTSSLLLGARLGYVVGAYPGTLASAQGHTIGPPFHAELRGTWVIGDEPLTKPGVAPYVFLGAGVARWDAATAIAVGEKGVVGDRSVLAWRVAGPVFASAGGGARYQFSPRVAASIGIDLTAALLPGEFAFVGAPELQLQYGF